MNLFRRIRECLSLRCKIDTMRAIAAVKVENPTADEKVIVQAARHIDAMLVERHNAIKPWFIPSVKA